MTRKGDWFQTYPSRTKFYILDPRPEDIDIRDIAHSLALKCRYGGHSAHFYSVAEHSVLLSYLVPPPLAFEALLHDAAETYTGDIMRPVKESIGDEWREIERRLDAVIAQVFNLSDDADKWALIKSYDTRILNDERTVLQFPPLPGKDYGAKLMVTIRCLPWQDAEVEFLARFDELAKRRIEEHDAVIPKMPLRKLSAEDEVRVRELADKLSPASHNA